MGTENVQMIEPSDQKIIQIIHEVIILYARKLKNEKHALQLPYKQVKWRLCIGVVARFQNQRDFHCIKAHCEASSASNSNLGLGLPTLYQKKACYAEVVWVMHNGRQSSFINLI